jgi:hypothetical protein
MTKTVNAPFAGAIPERAALSIGLHKEKDKKFRFGVCAMTRDK